MAVPSADKLDAWLAQREATVPALRPHCAKHIRWAQTAGEVTEVALVYVHGFSATHQELRPLPDMIADKLGANVYFARLAGHGQDGPAMGRPTLDDWRADVAEAIEIGSRLGRRVVVMGCSTGCTLLAAELATAPRVEAVIFVSPNFGLTHPIARQLLKLPKVRTWGHKLIGNERSFPTHSAAHAAYWTPQYPTGAVYTMSDAVEAARAADLSRIAAPVYVAMNNADQVVSPRRTRQTLARWGGTVVFDEVTQTARDDPMGHIMAGDIFSPDQTAPLAARISAWLAQV